MFSQRNNPYCDLLQICTAKVIKKNKKNRTIQLHYIFFRIFEQNFKFKPR